jgi:hypothetical protein
MVLSSPMHPVQCHHCGAPMQPGPDGRVYRCAYCGTQAQVAVAADQIAAGMALDLSNVDAFIVHLARSLQQAVPTQVTIAAVSGQVCSIELMLEPDGFTLRREGQRVVSQHKKVVRGIALKTHEVPLDQWVELLAQALARHANVNAQAGALAASLGRR